MQAAQTITIQTGLLTVIAVSEILRLYLTHRKVSAKKHFRQKQEGIKKMISDLDFKRFKSQIDREEIRKEHTNLKSRLNILEEKIKKEAKPGGMKEKDPGEYARLDDEKVRLERDIKRAEEKMGVLDAEITGLRPSADYPDGVTGINQQIEQLTDLNVLLAAWIRKL